MRSVWSGDIVEEANLKTLVREIRTAVEERGGRPDAADAPTETG